MTEHEQFRAMMKELRLTYPKIAEITGLTPNSVKDILQPNKDFPRWAKLVLWVHIQGKD